MKYILSFLFILISIFSFSQNRRDTLLSSSGDKITLKTINNKSIRGTGNIVIDTVINQTYYGSKAGLRALNNPKVTQANTSDFGKGIYIKDTSDHTTPDNMGTTIVSMDGGRFKRQYEGDDQFIWYKSTGANDSTALMQALRNCKSGVFIDSGLYEVNWIRLERNNISIKGIPGKTVLKLKSSAIDGSSIILFKDSIDHNISGLRIYGITFIGNTSGQTGVNTSIMAMGGPYGGPSTDTVTDVVVENCIFKDAPTTGAVRFISDTLRNNNWVFRNNLFDSSQGYHVTIWGSLNMRWEYNIIKNWANADTSAYPGFNLSTNLNKNLTLYKNQFFNNRGGRFAIEYAGALVNATFDGNYYNGNGRGGSGTSGGPTFNSTFIDEIKENGDGTHRAGYEIVGGGNIFFKDKIQNGSMLLTCINDAVAIPSGYDSLRNNGLNLSRIDIKNDLGGAIGLGGQNVNTSGLKNVTITNSQFETGGSRAAMEISAVRNLTIDNVSSNAKHYNIRFVNSKWSSTDSLSSDIIIRNSTLIGSSTIIGLGWPNIFINSPQSLTISKLKNITIENNHYSNNRIFYEDTLLSTWISRGNIATYDTTNSSKYDRNALFARGFGSPEGKILADIGSTYTDMSTTDRYAKTTNNSTTGWQKLPTTIFNAERAINYMMIGKGPGYPMDTTNAARVDPVKKYIGFGNTSSSPAYDLHVKGDSLISTNVRAWLENPAKTSSRFVSYNAVDGNGLGASIGYNGSYSYITSLGSIPLFFQTNGVNRGYIGSSGTWGIHNTSAAAGEMIAIGSVGDAGQYTMYGGTSGKITIKVGDVITTYTMIWPLTPGTVGQVLKLTSVGSGILQSAWSDDTGGGSGSGASLMGTSY